MAKDVKSARGAEPRALLRRLEPLAQKEARRGTPVVPEEHVLAPQVAVGLESVKERVGQRHDARPAALRGVGDAIVSVAVGRLRSQTACSTWS